MHIYKLVVVASLHMSGSSEVRKLK